MGNLLKLLQRKPAFKILIVIFGILLAVVILAVGIMLALNPSEVYSVFKGKEVYRNISIDGVSISGMTKKEALKTLAEHEEKLRDEYKLEVECDGKVLSFTKEALIIDFDTREQLEKLKTLKGGAELELSAFVTVNEAVFHPLLNQFAKSLYVKPREPEISHFDFEKLSFTVTNQSDGKRLLINSAKEAIIDFFKDNVSGKITLETLKIPAELTKDQLLSSLGQLGTFETECTNVYASEHNMRLAMEKMDKAIVKPGQVYSFHEAVGDSTTEIGGWMKSSAYRDGKLEQEYGGGICQASTMLYNSGLLSNMEVVERYNHLQPSDYCEIGLDATVDYPWVDCKMKNISDYPIYIVSKMEGKILTMTMYGYISPEYDKIATESWYTDYIDKPAPQFEVDDSLKEGQYIRERSGYSGYKAKAKRMWLDKDGNVIKEEMLQSSYYSEVAPLYKVGPNTDTSKIPPGSNSGIVKPKEPEKPEQSKPEENKPEEGEDVTSDTSDTPAP